MGEMIQRKRSDGGSAADGCSVVWGDLPRGQAACHCRAGGAPPRRHLSDPAMEMSAALIAGAALRHSRSLLREPLRVLEMAGQMLEGGVEVLQLRAKGHGPETILSVAQSLSLPCAGQNGVPLIYQ